MTDQLHKLSIRVSGKITIKAEGQTGNGEKFVYQRVAKNKGNLGNLGKYGLQLRKELPRNDRKSKSQLDLRKRLAAATAAWKRLTKAQRLIWKKLAAGRRFTGFNLFVSQFIHNPPISATKSTLHLPWEIYSMTQFSDFKQATTPLQGTETVIVETADGLRNVPVSEINPNIPGEVKLWAGVAAPAGWALCNGATLNSTSYAALYAAIGNTYGGSSGAAFNVPDLNPYSDPNNSQQMQFIIFLGA
jgi:hypothetical protein